MGESRGTRQCLEFQGEMTNTQLLSHIFVCVTEEVQSIKVTELNQFNMIGKGVHGITAINSTLT